MPTGSIWLLRLSLVSLLAGTGIGAWLLGHEPWGSLWLPRFRAAHVHLMLFGWLIPFVLGTAYWILPRHADQDERGSRAAATLAIGLLGLGIPVGLAGALLGVAPVQNSGTLCVVAGAMVLITLLWPRVKRFGSGRGVE